jgi:probable aminopeptidase NPEPL1
LDVLAITEVCSRMNSPGRPDCIAAAADMLPSKDCNVIVAVAEPSYVPKYAAAIGSALQTFSEKKGASTKSWALDIAFESVTGAAVSDRLVSVAQSLCESTRLAAKLVDTPPNMLNTTEMIQEARNVVDYLSRECGIQGVSIHVIEGKELETRGIGGIWNVGKAAEKPPALVVLTYKSADSASAGAAERTVALVGKGVMYDTGGLALKPREGMNGMKCDMGGSAAVLAAFRTLVSQKLVKSNTTLHGILCLAENAINERAFRNDDIIRLYSGNTVQVNNTDAEGRLCLADGVAYAEKDLKADTIATIATLTGAQGIATGVYFAAVMADREDVEARSVRVGRASGNLVHPIVYCPELLVGEFNSKVAQFTNSVKNRSNAQSSCAGEFIHQQLSDGYQGSFTHFDIAAPAFVGDRATGFGTSLLTFWTADDESVRVD